MTLSLLLDALRQSFAGWLFVLAVLTVFELLNRREGEALRTRIHGVIFWLISVPLWALSTEMLYAAWEVLGVRPLFLLQVPEGGGWQAIGIGVGAALVGAVAHDFFFYWCHRAQHRFLWRWHKVHHSVRHLNAVNSYHHITEPLLEMLLIQAPLTLLIGNAGPALPFVALTLWLHIVWIHSPTRATLGPLRVLMVDNRFHRIHHSLEERHFDKNFGAFTTVWDRLFGTCHMPAKDEWPDVGLEGVEQLAGVGDWFAAPWREGEPVPAEPASGRDPLTA
ncbi:sterol desaturase family protein [Sphingomonas sp. R-74633]|uniref:sterol desaturase family protein n=1 Tax=Sphingomonas sp. R-74633 TaxID=2751188 RepID=UPI0015D2DA5B|nr:sterol desaturase family protein [Sphingomonas sp. R-74633]NYT39625.1 sterol desaturase family protein [Sphingomonas sp. R-74633]